MLKKILLQIIFCTISTVIFSQCPIINGMNLQQIQDQGNGNCVYTVNYNYTSVANNKSIQIVVTCNGTQVLSQCVTVNTCNACTASSQNFTCACNSTKAVTITTFNNNGCGGGGTCSSYTLASIFQQEAIAGGCINWATENTSITKFEIEESNDGINFRASSTVGYSSTQKDYMYCITNSQANYYRIKAILNSGKEEYSKVLKNNFESNKIKVRYNASTKTVNINPTGIYLYAIYNLDGKTIFTGTASNAKINVAGLSNGNYLIRLQNKNVFETFRFTIY